MQIKRIVVDEMPKNCGECMLMQYVYDRPTCCGLPYEKDNDKSFNQVDSDPYSMRYRRHDCPLVKE